jgi:demethylmenaquinone methyltransferase/2-methoxy-6-polyprenyl-1,4-benzoquinol methylase
MGQREEYYDRRAAEYDETITDGLDSETAAVFAAELAALGRVLVGLPPARVLDVACGTGLFTQSLRGQVVALDRSQRMLTIARTRIPTAQLVQAVVPALPFGDASFDRLVTSHFYGHLVEAERVAFLAEARRVAPELVVVDTAAAAGALPDGWQERRLRDGSRYAIYKRHFTAEQLLAELGGDGQVLFAGRFFVAVGSWRSGRDVPAGLGDASAAVAAQAPDQRAPARDT